MRVNERLKKVFGILLCLCMVLQHVPATAFAVTTAEDGLCAHHTEHNTECHYVASVSGSDCTYHCHICHVQELVDALPGEVNAENAEAVAAQLTAIDNEKASLSDEELAQVDFTKYTATAEALGSVYAAVPAADFAVIIAETNNGKVEADKTTASEGDTVTLTVTADNGYVLDALKYNNGTSDTIIAAAEGVYSFTMPAGNVTVSATFKACDHGGNTNAPANNGDGTHDLVCSVCRTVTVDNEAHTENMTYVNREAEGHKAYYPCCQSAEDVAVTDHVYDETTHLCVCEDVEAFTLSFYAEQGNETPVATFSVPYDTELTMWESDEDDNETFQGATDYLNNLISQIDTTELTKEHYTFQGWDVENGPSSMYWDNSIYGIWTPVSYGITWDLAGGSETDVDLPTSVGYQNTIMVLGFFEKTGCTFSHLVDQDGNAYYDSSPDSDYRRFGAMPGKNLALTAVWNVNSYTLHAQGQSLNVAYGTALADALSALAPTKTGYTFTGWTYWLDEECTEAYTGTTMPARTVYVQPIFKAIEYNITWDMSGCSYELSNYSALPTKLAYNVDGYEYKVNFIDLTAPAGYEFVHFEDGNGNKLDYTVSDHYRLYVTVSGDMTIKAVIEPKSYKAIWESGNGDNYEKEFKYGETITIPTSEYFVETFRKSGYTLTGWTGYTEGMTMPIGGVTFTAVYTPNEYTITFDTDNGSEMTSITQAYKTAITAPEEEPTKDGYHFVKWEPEIPETMPLEGLTIKAVWEEHTGGTATCMGQKCTTCGTYYGEVDADNHTYLSNICCGTCGENAKWHFASGTLTISGTGAMTDFPYVTGADNRLQNGAPWKDRLNEITSVVIESGITTVGARAFYQCTALSSVVIPQSVTAIGAGAFHGCSSLTGMEVPASVKTIGQEAFCYSGLQTITLQEGLESIGHYALSDTQIETLTIPDSVTYIGRRLAGDCPNLTTIYMTGDSPNVDTNLLEHIAQAVTVYISGKTASGYEVAAWQNNNVTLVYVDKITAVAPIADRIYSGQAIEPALTVTNHKGETLTNGTDYTVTYNNNINAGTAVVTVTGAGSYGGTLEAGFVITPKPITVTAKNQTKTYGEAEPELTYNVVGLESNDAMFGKLTREAGEDVGTYAITQGTLTAGDNYDISYTGANLTINKKEVHGTDVSVVKVSMPYTGKEQTVELKVPDGATYTVAEGTLNATDVGMYELTIQFTGNYSGTVNKGWQITKAAPGFTAPTANGLYYTGEAQALVTAGTTANGTMMYKLGEDGTYSATVPSAENAGTYTVYYYVKGDNNYNDSAEQKVNVTIGQLDITGKTVDITLTDTLTYNGAEQTMGVSSAKLGDLTVTYTVSGNTGTDATDYTLTIIGSGNYKGTATKEWSIAQKSVTVTAKDQTITYGETISGTEITATGLVEGHSVTVTLTPSTANVTVSGTITASAAVITADGTDVTANYNVSDTSGKLVIEPDTSKIDALTTENVTSANEEDIKAVQAMMASAETNGIDEATAEQWAAITANCEDLTQKIEAVEAENTRITDAAADYDLNTVKSSDEAAITVLIADINEQLATNNLTDEERSALIDAKADAEALIDVIEEAQDAADTDATQKVEDVTAENVGLEDKEALEDAKADLEKALEENAGNYTEEEKQAIQDEIQRIEDAMVALEKVEDVTETISQLPETVRPDDEETAEKILDAKKAYDELTDYEKSLVDENTKKKLDGLVANLTAYDIIKGDGGKWTKGSSYGLSFTANGPLRKFVGIEVDGKEVASTYYTAEAGSTVITLKQSFLKRLSTGEHTITVLYTDGETSGTFEILAQSTTPATGDDSNIMLWSGMLCVSTLGLVVLLAGRKRRNATKEKTHPK